jgi:hypothetical protein
MQVLFLVFFDFYCFLVFDELFFFFHKKKKCTSAKTNARL